MSSANYPKLWLFFLVLPGLGLLRIQSFSGYLSSAAARGLSQWVWVKSCLLTPKTLQYGINADKKPPQLHYDCHDSSKIQSDVLPFHLSPFHKFHQHLRFSPSWHRRSQASQASASGMLFNNGSSDSWENNLDWLTGGLQCWQWLKLVFSDRKLKEWYRYIEWYSDIMTYSKNDI